MTRAVRLTVLSVAVVLVGLLASCTGHSTPTSTTTTITRTNTINPSPAPTAALPAGPTSVVTATTCPFLNGSDQTVADDVGMRLARITVLKNHGAVSGCRFYALQGTALHTSEHLPGPNQPAIEITTATFPSALAAHNAMVLLEQQVGHNVQQVTIGAGNIGLCFQTEFDPTDHGNDWACTYNRGVKLVEVKTVVLSPALDAVEIAKLVGTKL